MNHPGVLLSRTQLDFTKTKIATGLEPWRSAFAAMKASGYSSLTRVPKPVPEVRLGGTAYITAHPELGLTNVGQSHMPDAIAAYSCALIWYYTRDGRYAEKARSYIDAWASTLKSIAFDQPRRLDSGGQVFDQGLLEAAWAGPLWARTGEILRYTTSAWPAGNATKVEYWLKNVYLPLVINGWWANSNWMMSCAEAMTSIGVYCNDEPTFFRGVDYWRAKLPSTIYMPRDGAQPVACNTYFTNPTNMKTYWFNPTSYLTGLQQETLRDLSHMMMGMGAMINTAETARIQGVDLYGAGQDRIVTCYELEAKFVNAYLDAPSVKPQGWPSSNLPNSGGLAFKSGWETAYSEYALKRKISMPETKKLIARLRPSQQPANHVTWDILTHAR